MKMKRLKTRIGARGECGTSDVIRERVRRRFRTHTDPYKTTAKSLPARIHALYTRVRSSVSAERDPLNTTGTVAATR